MFRFNTSRPRVDFQAAPADVVALGTSEQGQLAECRSRIDEADRLITAAMEAQSLLHAEDRNDQLLDTLLDLRKVLRRSSTPTNPGRSP